MIHPRRFMPAAPCARERSPLLPDELDGRAPLPTLAVLRVSVGLSGGSFGPPFRFDFVAAPRAPLAFAIASLLG